MIAVTLRGMVVEGKDGQHHDEDCCSVPARSAWSREDKGLDHPAFLEAPWRLPAMPRKGESIELPDSGEGQSVEVQEVVYKLDGTIEVWIGGWSHWKASSVRLLFAAARERVEASA